MPISKIRFCPYKTRTASNYRMLEPGEASPPTASRTHRAAEARRVSGLCGLSQCLLAPSTTPVLLPPLQPWVSTPIPGRGEVAEC